MLLVPCPSVAAADGSVDGLRPQACPSARRPFFPFAVQAIVTIDIAGDSFTYNPGVHNPNVVSMMGKVTVAVAIPNHPTIVNLIDSVDAG